MNVNSSEINMYSGSSYYMNLNGFVKFLGVVKTSHNMYRLSYLSDPADSSISNYNI